MNMRVISSFTFAGIHHWDGAPDDISHLRNPHRHLFHVQIVKDVTHLDRDVEIILLGKYARAWMMGSFKRLKCGSLDLGQLSCEMIAEMFVKKLELHSCRVLEDGENGAEIIA